MGVPFEVVAKQLPAAARDIFEDRTVRSVGIGADEKEGGFCLFVVRNSAGDRSFSAPAIQADSLDIPVVVRNTPHEVERQSFGENGASVSRATAIGLSTVPPRYAGLQIQNFDNDVRLGLVLGPPHFATLGCFVRLGDDTFALLSTNHVVAGANHGVRGTDRILQQGGFSFVSAQHVATLTDFVSLQPSPQNASVRAGTVIFNRIDASVARRQGGVAFQQGYAPSRNLVTPHAVRRARINDTVFKVGRTTGLTTGTIKSVTNMVGPLPYTDGPTWFDQSIMIESDEANSAPFCGPGDSGAAIVTTAGEIVGILYSSNGTQAYACPIADVFQAFGCVLA
ncbi:MAG: hypothetical protein QOI58_1529 [Thermoanaerobaculia bacterium]|jgi:hypothetical protein|nr:hypothetical protein [Thermoanaerobaculia bacterium]